MNKIMPSLFLSVLLFTQAAHGLTEDLGNGFMHHGVATPVSNHRGTVATVDGEGRNVILVWLFDHRGGYALLMIDAETGASNEYPVPFPPGGDCPQQECSPASAHRGKKQRRKREQPPPDRPTQTAER